MEVSKVKEMVVEFENEIMEKVLRFEKETGTKVVDVVLNRTPPTVNDYRWGNIISVEVRVDLW